MTDPQAETFIRTVRPFDVLDDGDINRVADALTPSHFAPGDVVIQRLNSPGALYIVADGGVEESDQAGPINAYGAGSTFDCVGLINGRSENSFVARTRSACYLMPAQLFHALSRRNPAFRDFFLRELNRRLDVQVAAQQQREASSFLLARLGEGHLHPPVFVDPKTTLVDAARLMRVREISALLVRRGDAVGIFTERDVRERSVLMGMPDSTPIGDLASERLFTLDHDDFLFNALVLMTEQSIRHIVVTRGGEIEGVFEQADLLSVLANSSYVVASKVDRSTTSAELAQAVAGVTQLVRSLFERGVKPRYIARIITDINRKTFRKVFEKTVPPGLQDRVCLIVMGSEGRGEQLLRTDQDNGLIFALEPMEGERATVADAFTRDLIDLGYPPCPGNVMVANPQWSKSLEGYRRSVRAWVAAPTGDALLNLAILLDASAIAGDGALLGTLKSSLMDLVSNEDALAGHFARAVLAFPTPLGLFGRITMNENLNGKRGIDIKKGGIFPIVHGVRSLALQYRITETNTIGRIQALCGRGPFSEEFTADLIEALDFMMMLRLRQQFSAIDRGDVYGNIVPIDDMHGFERNLLRSSLKIVKHFKTDVAHHFRLDMLT
ncbi:MAG: cyclic nucleotide-binding/CBS domain-containing protein [Rhodospirillales bacterium]|nr:cyclic nucleotide-binding/CBS domain-containing protein [Rhodospirillales bacterium]